jgi:hypothetical protein
MDDGEHIECFNFLNFFLGEDLVEVNGHNISDHFALRMVDLGLMDEAVDAVQANGTVVEVIGGDDLRNVERFPRFVVKP